MGLNLGKAGIFAYRTPSFPNSLQTTLTAKDAEDAEERQGRKSKRDMKNCTGASTYIGASF